MFNQYIEELKQELLLIENSYPVSTPSELARIRCPICGDSLNPKSAHFYIGVKEYNGNQVPVYDCKKCGLSGMVNSDLLRRVNIVNITVEEYLKSLKRNQKIRSVGFSDDPKKIKFKYPKINKSDEFKVEYLSDRLQMDFSKQENLEKYKIVLNFKDFLEINNLTEPQVSKDNILPLSEYGIGFISESRTSINIRSMDTSKTKGDRFNIVHLFPNKRIPFTYMPPCSVNIISQTPRIAVSESAFNIICVKRYFYGEDDTNTIFGSSSRKNCLRTVKKLIQTSGFVNGSIDIFADRDNKNNEITVDFFRNTLKDYIDNYDISVFINEDPNEKDFGVMPKPGEKFKYKIYRI